MNRAGASALLLAFALAACGGTPNTPDGSVVNSPGGPSSPPPTLVKASLVVTVPRASSNARGAHYVSPKTKSVVVALASSSSVSATTIDVRPSGPGCKENAKAIVCHGAVEATPGNDTFNVTTFAGPDGTGPVLSAGQVTATIAASSGSVAVSHLSLALDGIIAAIRLTITPSHANVGKPFHAAVAVTAYDAAGAAIVGASEYSQPIVLSIQGDSSGAFSLREGTTAGSSVSLAKPAVPVALLYDGNPNASSIALQASIAGASLSATAAFTLSGTGPPPDAGDIYVLNAGTDGGLGATVTVYDAKATGNAAPKLTLQLDAKRYAQTIALDAKQQLYVGYFDSPTGASAATGQPDAGNEIAVFAQGASGSAAPVATIQSGGPTSVYPAAIAFDAAGNLVTYGATTVDGSDGNDATLIYAPGASGSPAPIHAWGFTSPYFHFPGPTGLELDAAGNFTSPARSRRRLPRRAASSSPPRTASTQRSRRRVRCRGMPSPNWFPDKPGRSGWTHPTKSTSRTSRASRAAAAKRKSTRTQPDLRAERPTYRRCASHRSPASPLPTRRAFEPGNLLAAHFPALAVFGSYVYAGDDFNNAIAAYPIGASGNVSPPQTIAGSATALDAPIAIAVAPASKTTVSVRDSHVRYSSQDAPR